MKDLALISTQEKPIYLENIALNLEYQHYNASGFSKEFVYANFSQT